MENWRSYKEELILEEKILNELAQLERIDEGAIQDIAKKIGVSAAKVMLIAKLLSPAIASAQTSQADDLQDRSTQTTQVDSVDQEDTKEPKLTKWGKRFQQQSAEKSDKGESKWTEKEVKDFITGQGGSPEKAQEVWDQYQQDQNKK